MLIVKIPIRNAQDMLDEEQGKKETLPISYCLRSTAGRY